MKKAIIISYHDSHDYETRIKYLEDFLRKKDYNIQTLISDFDHRNKKVYNSNRMNTISLHVTSYKKNLSIRRVISYIVFEKQCKNYIINCNNIDIIYLLAPPNILISMLSKIKYKFGIPFIVEIGDMWPESFPVSLRIKKIIFPLFKVWSNLRDKYINNADYVITECDLFQQQLKRNGLKTANSRVYFCKNSNLQKETILPSIKKTIVLGYLGSINNIIDINFISKLVKGLSMKRIVKVIIIGEGEKERDFIQSLESAGAICEFYGPVFNDNKKRELLSHCQFALNIMKKNVFVGMTMKSLDYFSYGIPIINNIHGDIWDVIEREGCGINANKEYEIVDIMLQITDNDYENFRRKTIKTQQQFFSTIIYENQMEKIFKNIEEPVVK